MKKAVTFALVTILVAGTAFADKEFSFDKKDNFDGVAVTSIAIDMDRGDIMIEESRGQNIEVLYKNVVLADNQSEADEMNEDYQYRVEVVGGKLSVKVDTPRHGNRGGKNIVERIIEGDWSQNGSYPMIKLAIPDGKAVEIVSASSDIDVADLKLDLEIESASSDITLETTEGKVFGDISSGDINITGHRGSITIEAKSSDIRLVDIEGEIDAGTASGDIDIEKVKGPTRAYTASGDGRLYDIDGDIDIEAASGDIEVNSTTGSIKARAVSGDIRLDGLTDKDGAYDVQSVSGDIYMTITRGFAGDVTIKSVSGSINSSMSEDLETDRESFVAGQIGQGNGRLKVSTTSGDISIDRY
jgi:hypothetical protein